MSDETTIRQTKRTAQSLRFERAVRASIPGTMPRLSDVDYSSVRDLVPWIAVVDPDRAKLSLRFMRAGAGISTLVGREAVGLDYLDLVDPAIKGDAFDSCFLMLSRPCGLWQITPATMADGSTLKVEYTGFPVFDDERGRGQIIIMIAHSIPDVVRVPRIDAIRHASEWHWLELRNG